MMLPRRSTGGPKGTPQQTIPHNMPTEKDAIRVTILNQYYVPDVASTGHLLHELANHLAKRGDDVHVIACIPSYGPPDTWQPAPKKEFAEGVHVRRMRTTRFSKDSIPGRVLNSITFLVPLFFRMLFQRRSDHVYLYTTNPPYLGIIGAVVSLVRRHPYVILLHDSYPQLAVWVGKIRKGGIIDRLWHRANRLMYHRAKETIVLCPSAQQLVCDTYDVPISKVHVIPNWADAEGIHPIPKGDSQFAHQHGLGESFVALYSGNLGLYYEFETILGAAERLLDDNFRLVFIGAGGRRFFIEQQIKERSLSNTMLLPYQPFATLNDSLNASDASFVTIAEGIEGISFPSKLYSSLAVGRPILAISAARSDLRDIIWVELGDADGLAAGIRRLMSDPELAAEMGRNARALFEAEYTITKCAGEYHDVLVRARPETG